MTRQFYLQSWRHAIDIMSGMNGLLNGLGGEADLLNELYNEFETNVPNGRYTKQRMVANHDQFCPLKLL